MLMTGLTNLFQKSSGAQWAYVLCLLITLVFGLPEIAMLGLSVWVGWQIVMGHWQQGAFDVRFVTVAVGAVSVFFLKAASALWAQDAWTAASNAFNHIHFLMWPFLALLFSRDKPALFLVERLVGISMLFMGVWYVIAWVWFPASEDAVCFKAGGHNCGLLGQTLAFYLLWFYVILTRQILTLRQRLFFSMCWLMGWLAFLGTMRRSEMLVVIAGLVILTGVRVFQFGNWRQHLLGSALAALALTCVAVWSLQPAFVKIQPEVEGYLAGGDSRVQAALSTSVGSRLEQYRIAWQGIAEKPLLGWGAGIKPRHLPQYAIDPNRPLPFSNFHQQYLQVLLEVGWLGGLTVAAILIYLFRLTVLLPARGPANEAALVMLCLWMVYVFKGVFGVTIGYGHVNAVLVLYGAILWSQIYPSNKLSK